MKPLSFSIKVLSKIAFLLIFFHCKQLSNGKKSNTYQTKKFIHTWARAEQRFVSCVSTVAIYVYGDEIIIQESCFILVSDFRNPPLLPLSGNEKKLYIWIRFAYEMREQIQTHKPMCVSAKAIRAVWLTCDVQFWYWEIEQETTTKAWGISYFFSSALFSPLSISLDRASERERKDHISNIVGYANLQTTNIHARSYALAELKENENLCMTSLFINLLCSIRKKFPFCYDSLCHLPFTKGDVFYMLLYMPSFTLHKILKIIIFLFCQLAVCLCGFCFLSFFLYFHLGFLCYFAWMQKENFPIPFRCCLVCQSCQFKATADVDIYTVYTKIYRRKQNRDNLTNVTSLLRDCSTVLSFLSFLSYFPSLPRSNKKNLLGWCCDKIIARH